ncbi:MAG: hypothetical protein HY471_02820, partial [Candidatus Sungbacteria bacterium]|nr:hypothetical protein [Candidatus Sungbacteria bacterium]
ILERMKRHGEFSVRQTRPENGKWIFLIDEVRPPLNILVLTNLFHQDSWVRRAYPYFKFLHDPITATINVEPVSGTVGEVRTATFTVKIFDPAIELSTDLLPQFGEGLFHPLQSGRQPPGYLFERLGDPVKRELRDKQSRLYVFSRRFKHHALGEWHISAQPVSFTKNGVPQEIKSSGVTFVVNSQIGALNITDMPQPQSLIHLAEAPAVTPQVELPQAPVYWFDKYRWVADPDGVAKSLRSAAVPLGSFSAAMLYVLFLLWAARGKKQMVERHEKLWRLERRMDGAKAEGSYQKYEEALLAILRVAFPHLPSRPTREGVKADESIRGLWGAEKLGVLGRIFEELDRRYMKDFTPDPKTLLVLDRDIRSLFETVRRDLISGKEVG